MSYASAAHKLSQELGCPARRDEVYVKTHTRKNGVPLDAAASTIKELKDIAEIYSDLKDNTIQQGDIFAIVCGEKEPKGRVRCLGLGPTPQDIGTRGLKVYTSTRLQIQVLARQKAESENLLLRQRIMEMERTEEQRRSQEFKNCEAISQNGSNSKQQMFVQGEEDAEDDSCDEDDDDVLPKKAVQHNSKDALVGSEVILFAMSGDEKVAKATIVSVNPNNKLADVDLGTKFCEVIVNVVLKRETPVPRPYGEIETLGDALTRPIAWSFHRLKLCSQQPRSADQGVAPSRSAHRR